MNRKPKMKPKMNRKPKMKMKNILLCAGLLLACTVTVPGQPSNQTIVQWASNSAPTVCPILPLYVVAAGYTGAGNLYGNSGSGTGCALIASPGGGTTGQALTMNNSGSGAASGTTFDGSTPVTLSYNTLGAAPLASPALTGTPTTPTAAPLTNSTQISSTAYTDAAVAAAVAGINPAVAVLAASTANLTGTYAQVGGGVGDTFTVTATGAFTLDGIAINTIGQRVLLKNQSTASQNGVYTATVVGSIGVSPVFTRATDYNTPSDVNNTGAIPVQSGTANTTTSWLLTSQVTSIGSAGSSLTYALFSYAPTSLLLVSGGATTGIITGPGYWPQSLTAGPYVSWFEDFFSAVNSTPNNIGSATGAACLEAATYSDQNHIGNLRMASGTGGSGTGNACFTVGAAPQILSINTAPAWTWETSVIIPVLPSTTSGSYQAGMVNSGLVSPWTTGVGFGLCATALCPSGAAQNNWYCEYASTYVDSTVAATTAWTRLTMKQDGTNLHWYINGTEACGTGVAIASLPSTNQFFFAYTDVAGSGTSVLMAVDYALFQRQVTR